MKLYYILKLQLGSHFPNMSGQETTVSNLILSVSHYYQ